MRAPQDFFRLIGGLFYWNTRKTLYRLRGARGPCPCQHPGDSGRAWETDCDAAAHYHNSARFRRVCPLYRRDATGRWRCSVNQNEVRPFWGRVFVLSGGSLAVLYLVATLAVFGVFRGIGYPVSYADIAWPPAWKKLDEIKSDFFFAKFRQAYAAHDVRAGLLNLALARELNPKNYRIGLVMAQLCRIGQPGLSNAIFRQLIADHPDQAEPTAQSFFTTLLARGDFPSIQTLARDRLLAPGAASAAWLNAFLFANARTREVDALAALAADPRVRRFPSGLQTVLTLAARLNTATPAAARQLLVSAADGASGYAFYYICDQLTRLGFPDATLTLLDRQGIDLSGRDHALLLLNALAARKWDIVLKTQFDAVLVAPPTPAVVELLCTHLIDHPDAALLEKLFLRLRQSPLPPDSENYAATLTLFLAAGVNDNQECLDWSAARLAEILGFKFALLDDAADFLTGRKKIGHLGNILPVLQPLPLQTMYALFDHYEPPAPTLPK